MLIILPVCTRDAAKAIVLGEWMNELDAYHEHSLLILFDAEVSQSDRNKIRFSFANLFGHTEVYKVTAPSGWPSGPNEMFKTATVLARERAMPWYFFEPDNVPTRKGWLYELAFEYHGCGRQFMGALEMEYVEPTPGQLLPIGRYLMGSAIYPRDVGHYAVLFCLPSEVPFDVALKPFLMDHELVRETALIANRWNTINYQMDGESIICDPATPRQGQRGYGVALKISQPFPAVIHGCKDDSLVSLLRLLRSEMRIVSAHDAQESCPAVSGFKQHADAVS